MSVPVVQAASMNPERLNTYLRFVEERHRVWELRQLGAPQPWTEDPILANRKFTNVFRVLDPGSQFVFELEDGDPWVTLFRLFLYRYTNEPATWKWLHGRLDQYPAPYMRPEKLIDAITDYRSQGYRVFSGAYVILPQPNRPGDKVVQAVELAYRWMDNHSRFFLEADTQQERFAILTREYGVGPFMAMQILTDWGYTHHVGEDREHEFVIAGPGAIKGARAINSRISPLETIHTMHALVQMCDEVPVVEGRTPSLMDIQNTLCEFSKYVRFQQSVTPGRQYRPVHPGAQPAPILPEHFRQN